ncbi:gamma-glutamylcysteine synthetase, putative [Eimeria tenella]|uniref:Glutamate--cysteine ligase n=1 Tax=Eimeria tenella TaxID=5802 RepID=U6KUL1_EIMTE|nr:gamma-glutamylcysteine synthetase, putative [Eimeria tenella]CDJ41646.1 gamma-glutamylcysteine synthetase, putative [Eimeria tenella]|eukprot:XP_013232396.1 gamma-glutamylcysteine synthetase, putative [Eimeria tenella]
MGFLGLGEPLSWNESLPYIAAIKRRGVRQFLLLFKQFKDFQATQKWGDELEIFIVQVDEESKRIRLAPEAQWCIEVLRAKEQRSAAAHAAANKNFEAALWQPEYAAFMLEALPGAPLPWGPPSWARVEPSIRSRRRKLLSWLGPRLSPLFLPSFPLLGVEEPAAAEAPAAAAAAAGGASPQQQQQQQQQQQGSPPNPLSRSLFLADTVINPHPRFGTLTANIRMRRGSKVEALVPLYMDRNTPSVPSGELNGKESLIKKIKGGESGETRKQIEDALVELRLGGRSCVLCRNPEGPSEDPHLRKQTDLCIYMDAMCFGMGMNCVQATFSPKNLAAARYLYDQLIVLAPLLLSITAATPFLRGCVAATDTRWDTISMSVDSRKPEEKQKITKSRYSSNSLYISDSPALTERLEELNDVEVSVNEKAFEALVKSGVDAVLARHIAFLFVHDPLVIFKDRLLQKGKTEEEIIAEGDLDWTLEEAAAFESPEDFENLQSTNWNGVRFKPPPQFLNTAESSPKLHFKPSKDSKFEKKTKNGSENHFCFQNSDKNPQSSDKNSRNSTAVQPQDLIGWRVEMRTPEIQITDFENAACIILIAALVHLIEEEGIELYIPMSLNDKNMAAAAKLNSVLNQKFYFRKEVEKNSRDKSVAELSVHSILFGEQQQQGDPPRGPALLERCRLLLLQQRSSSSCSAAAFESFMEMYNFIYLRTSGILPTDAAFLRACLAAHPDYKGDSAVAAAAAFDICKLAMKIGSGELEVPELLGPFARRSSSSSCCCCCSGGDLCCCCAAAAHGSAAAAAARQRSCSCSSSSRPSFVKSQPLMGPLLLQQQQQQQQSHARKVNPEAILHGRGRVAAALQHSAIQQKLRTYMGLESSQKSSNAKTNAKTNKHKCCFQQILQKEIQKQMQQTPPQELVRTD